MYEIPAENGSFLRDDEVLDSNMDQENIVKIGNTFKCPNCDMVLSSLFNLKRHIDRKHIEDTMNNFVSNTIVQLSEESVAIEND